jgi:hypothetical protein
LRQAGIEIDLPAGWEGRIFTPDPGAQPSSRVAVEHTRPILHAANFALPVEIGDYGGGAVELMSSGHVFVALIDFGTAAANTPLFANLGIPVPLRTEQFDPAALQRTLPGQSGTQQFFTTAGRGFCLYVVLGANLLRGRLLPLVNDALVTLRVA